MLISGWWLKLHRHFQKTVNWTLTVVDSYRYSNRFTFAVGVTLETKTSCGAEFCFSSLLLALVRRADGGSWRG